MPGGDKYQIFFVMTMLNALHQRGSRDDFEAQDISANVLRQTEHSNDLQVCIQSTG